MANVSAELTVAQAVVQFISYAVVAVLAENVIFSRALGVSPSSAYELLHEDGFPSLRIGSRLVVPKE